MKITKGMNINNLLTLQWKCACAHKYVVQKDKLFSFVSFMKFVWINQDSFFMKYSCKICTIFKQVKCYNLPYHYCPVFLTSTKLTNLSFVYSSSSCQ